MTCPHGMPTPAACVACMDEGPVAPPAHWQRIMASFRSSYEGTCPGCGNEYPPETLIQRWDYGAGPHVERTVYTHAGCRPDETGARA